MDRPLLPWPLWPLRYVLVVVLSLPAAIAPVGFLSKLLAVAFVTVIVGSVRVTRVSGTDLEAQQFIAFMPFKPDRCKLKFVTEIEAGHRKEPSMTDFLMFGIFNWVMDRIMQWVWPWMAGEYELWVVTAREKRMLAWRGNGDDGFLANLQILTSATGAAVTRKS